MIWSVSSCQQTWIALYQRSFKFNIEMDFLRLILLICFTTFLGGIGYAAIIPRSDAVRKVHEKPGESNGPVYTFVKTDKKANLKWGVRHYLPRRH